MKTDSRAVISKEWKPLLRGGARRTKTVVGWLAPLLLAVGLVVVNIVDGDHWPLVYSPRALLTDLVLSFFFALITAGAGVIVSLRAETAQEGQVTLGAPLMALGGILATAPLALRLESGRCRNPWPPPAMGR